MTDEWSMSGTERRDALWAALQSAGRPLTGSELARRLRVSRQVIVQDVAILRAAGTPVVATPQGYAVAAGRSAGRRAVVAVRHPVPATATELYALVDAGVWVEDVVVEHPIYGELTGRLDLRSHADVQRFLTAVRLQDAHLLSELTDGVHLHTLRAGSAGALEAARDALRGLGFLIED